MDKERLLKLIAKHECHDSFFWDEGLEFMVNCNDFFGWAMADAEPVETDEDIDMLEQALKDSKEDGPLLYCARKRKMRPQGAFYKYLTDKELFNACGPEREIDFFNPQSQEGDYQYNKENITKHGKEEGTTQEAGADQVS